MRASLHVERGKPRLAQKSAAQSLPSQLNGYGLGLGCGGAGLDSGRKVRRQGRWLHLSIDQNVPHGEPLAVIDFVGVLVGRDRAALDGRAAVKTFAAAVNQDGTLGVRNGPGGATADVARRAAGFTAEFKIRVC